MALPDVTLPVGDGQLKGAGVSPAVVANSVLRRSFLEYEPLNSMKLQRLMYFIACLYQRESGFVLLSEQFQRGSMVRRSPASMRSSNPSMGRI